MLNEYKEAILSLCQLQDEYDKLDIQSTTINRNKRRAKKELRRTESDRDDLRDEVKEKLIKEKKAEFDYLLEEVETDKQKMLDLNNKMNQELENISLDRFNKETSLDTEILVTLGDTFAYLSKELPDIVGRFEYDYDVCLEHLDSLANKCGSDNLCKPIKSRVQILTDLEEDEEKSTFENILDKIVGVPKDVDFPLKYRVMMYGGYLFVIFLAFFNLSFLLLGALGVGFKAIYDSKREESYKKKCIQYLEDFKSMFQILFNSLNTRKEEYLEEEKEKIVAKYYDRIKNAKDSLDAKSSDYSIKTNSVVVSEEEVNQAVDIEFNAKLEELHKILEEYDLQIKQVLDNQKKCETDLDEVQNRISSLRDSISEVYWELTEVGSEKVIMKEFFLGFKDYDLISVKHDGNAMAIVYDGDSSERNSVLISMFIAQLFSNMLPNVLNISIVDIDYTCRDYSIYNGGVFDLLFNYVTAEGSVNKLIEELHSDLIKRQSEISPIADTIDDFNRMMIERNSFTKEYRFIIFQNANVKYLKNQKLLQLCRTGQAFGIMPIIFISKDLYNGIVEGTAQGVEDCKSLVDSLRDYTWRFKQDTLDLEKI